MAIRRLLLGFLVAAMSCQAKAAEAWPEALARMPLGTGAIQLNRTNCVELMLRAFRSDPVVKAMIFMPGATDEFYMFRRAKADLPQASPTLLDAVAALTNQTLVRASFQAPFLLFHTEEDFLNPDIVIRDEQTIERLKHTRCFPHLYANDRDWDALQPQLKWAIGIDLRPWKGSRDSWHFYRHSFAAWDPTAWEAFECAALAGKSRFVVYKNQVRFEPDSRIHPPSDRPTGSK